MIFWENLDSEFMHIQFSILSSGARFRDPNQRLVSDVIFVDQKQDGTASRKRECNQKIVFTLWRIQSLMFLKIYGEIQIFAK